MAVCKSCGSELKPGTKFCENCGTRIEVTSAVPTTASASPRVCTLATNSTTHSTQSVPSSAYSQPITQDIPQQSMSAPQTTTNPPPHATAQSGKKLNKQLIFAIVGLVVIAGVFMLGKRSGKSPEPASNAASATTESAKATEVPAAQTDAGDAGIYIIDTLQIGETVVASSELAEAGMGNWYVELRKDGTGEIYIGEVANLTWADGKMILQEGDETEDLTFTRNNDVLAITGMEDDLTLNLKRTDAKPDITAELAAASDDGENYNSGNTYDTLLNTTWYGWIRYENYNGVENRSYFDTDTYDCWGYIEESSDGRTYFEVYKDGDSENAVISMWVNVYDDHIEPILDDECWVIDTLIPADEAYNFYIYPYDNSIQLLWYPYENDNGQSCSVSFFMRLDGTEWDEAYDELPPRYDEYKAALAK